MQSDPGQSEVHIKALPPGEEISQQLRTLAILQEVLSSNLSNHMVAHNNS